MGGSHKHLFHCSLNGVALSTLPVGSDSSPDHDWKSSKDLFLNKPNGYRQGQVEFYCGTESWMDDNVEVKLLRSPDATDAHAVVITSHGGIKQAWGTYIDDRGDCRAIYCKDKQ
jgi:hypothetical protein